MVLVLDGNAPKRSSLYRGLARGEWERVARGIYAPAGMPLMQPEWLEATTRRPEATICLTSALAYWDLTDEIPERVHVAIWKGARKPATRSPLAWHHLDRDSFDTQRREVEIPGSDGRMIGIYSPERSVVDCFRLRALVGYETATAALHELLAQGGDRALLMRLAMCLPRARRPLLDILEALN